jgi:hypothetical protein
MDLSIIIVNWNTRDLLAQCLQSVYDTVQGLAFEVFVVDNASTDGSADMVRERFPDVRLIENAENVGFARANNQAIRESCGRHVLLVNSDVIILPGTVARLRQALDQNEGVAVAGVVPIGPDGSVQSYYGSFPTVLSEIFGISWLQDFTKPWSKCRIGRKPVHESPFLTDRVSACCILVRRAAIDQVGLFDEQFFLFSEEYDWYLRFKQHGWRIWCDPAARVVHHWGGSSTAMGESAKRLLYRSKRQYYMKHQGRPAESILRAGLAVRFTSKALLEMPQMLWGDSARTSDLRNTVQLIVDMMQPLARSDNSGTV